jgi:hypothetical protein
LVDPQKERHKKFKIEERRVITRSFQKLLMSFKAFTLASGSLELLYFNTVTE